MVTHSQPCSNNKIGRCQKFITFIHRNLSNEPHEMGPRRRYANKSDK